MRRLHWNPQSAPEQPEGDHSDQNEKDDNNNSDQNEKDDKNYVEVQHLGLLIISSIPFGPSHRSVCMTVHNAYIEQLKFLAVVCAQTMPKKSQKIYDGTYLFPGADNCEENREKAIFVSLTL